MTNFIIYALPRSRTAWCAKYLTYKDWVCSHEIALKLRSISDLKAVLQKENYGTAETGVAQGHWLINYYSPDIKQVVILRNVPEVVESLMGSDISGVAEYNRKTLTKHMEYGYRSLLDISKLPNVLTLSYNDLKGMSACKKLFEHCLPYEFDIKHWGKLKNQNIQINMKEMLRYYFTNKEEITYFKKLCKRELISLRRTDKDNPVWKN